MKRLHHGEHGSGALGVAGLDQSALIGQHHGLQPVTNTELGQHPVHMGADGAFGDEQSPADLELRSAAGMTIAAGALMPTSAAGAVVADVGDNAI